MSSVSRMSAIEEIHQKFAIGTTQDYVHITVLGSNGDTSTKTVSKVAARELAIQILQAAQ